LKGNLQMKKSLLCLSLLTFLILSSCSDRTRINCERIKNKAPETIGTAVQIGGGRCG
jgi:hypothetical protein